MASDGQHESIGDIVDMLIGEIVDDVGRKSMSGVSLNDTAAKRCGTANIPRMILDLRAQFL